MESFVLKDLYKYYSFLLTHAKTSILKELNSESFGDSLAIIDNDGLKIKFVKEKSRYFIEIMSLTNPNVSYDLHFFYGIIYNDNDYELMDQKKMSDFLKSNLERIRIMMNEENYADTTKKLELLKKHRLKKKFPKIF